MTTSGKIAIITGAGSGIGRASALTLLKNGYHVALSGRRRERLDETAALAKDSPGECLVVPTDIREPESVAALFSATVEAFGRVDVLFNNAGGNFSRYTPIEDVAFEDWRATIDTNLTGTFLCSQQAFRAMRDQKPGGGRIINNGSISAHVPRADSPSYTASKHGITGLTKQMALDGRKFDIACGQIDVGNAGTSDHNSHEQKMDVQHVADAILYMANLPLDANVLFLTVMVSKMPYIGRG